MGLKDHPIAAWTGGTAECIVVTRLRWREGLVLLSGHVGAMGDSHLQDGSMNTIQLCLERGVRLEDGLHKTA